MIQRQVGRTCYLVKSVMLPRITKGRFNFAPKLRSWRRMSTQDQSPNPNWKPRDKQPSPYANLGTVTLDPAKEGHNMYSLMISSITPRPIAFISTVNNEGVGNLAPFSYFGLVSHAPPCVCVGLCHDRTKGKKDTLVNIEQTGEFTLNMISEWFIEAANHTSGLYDYGVDEMKLSGLTPIPSTLVKAPRVAESAIQFECVLRHSYPIKDASGATTSTAVIAEVKLVHVSEGVYYNSKGKHLVDFEKLKPIARIGGDTYAYASKTFDIPRPPKEAQEFLKPRTDAKL